MATSGALPHVQEAFKELERLLGLRQTQPHNRPAIADAERHAYRGLLNALDLRGSLRFDINSEGTQFGETALHHKGTACGQLFGNLFHDGLRSIEVSAELNAEEWHRFIQLVSMEREMQNVVPGGLATALWKEDLPSLAFEFRRRRRLLIEDDPDEVERDQRRIARVVTDMIAYQDEAHARLAQAEKLATELADEPIGKVPAAETIESFAKLIIEMVEIDHEGADTEILQRATLNLARESFISGELQPLMAFFRALKAPAEEGLRAQAIRRDRLATLLAGACCDPHLVVGFGGEDRQLALLTTLLGHLGFDAVTPYLRLLHYRPEPQLAEAVAKGLGERLNSAAADLRIFLKAPETQKIIAPFLEGLSELEPSPQVIGVLEPLRKHANLNVAEVVADLLSRAVKVDDLAEARRLLDSRDGTERRAALRFFQNARDEKAAQMLVDFLGVAATTWDALSLRRAYACLGAMRSHHGHAFLKKVLTARSLMGGLKSSTEEQILAVRGLVSANDAFARELLDQVMTDKIFSGKVRLALTRMQGK